MQSYCDKLSGSGIHCLAANSELWQNYWDAFSTFVVSRGGNLSTMLPVRNQKHFQQALRKFQSFTGSL